ncbi:MAG: tRNA 2-thiouridine(34) synthase MnmA [Bacteroidales bacterium]|nr:tRNA 2-thiouridine(34) synthase MnmA [Bacteroidales bacterium]
MTKVVVGLSGGVDSSVAAYLLKQQGYDVIGLFMINWHDTTGTLDGDCPWGDDLIFAELVARKLDIPFHTVDFSEEYRKRVVDYMFAEYRSGRTPNPDVLCNREVKFDLFIDKADELGADLIATGHHCQRNTLLVNGTEVHQLLAGADPGKDQSYFLCQLNQKQLSRVLFPIGHMQKSELRQIAEKEGLATAKRKDSQGICFVGKVDLPVFLQQKLSAKEGNIIEVAKDTALNYPMKAEYGAEYTEEELQDICAIFRFRPEDGEYAGKHRGAHFLTIGQRKGLNVGGKKEPLFVLGTDIENNLVYVGQGHDHPGLNRFGLFIPEEDIHWVRGDLKMQPDEMREYRVRIRYRQPLQDACVYRKPSGIYITFREPQRGITSGQFAAWYDGPELVGSGVIY